MDTIKIKQRTLPELKISEGIGDTVKLSVHESTIFIDESSSLQLSEALYKAFAEWKPVSEVPLHRLVWVKDIEGHLTEGRLTSSGWDLDGQDEFIPVSYTPIMQPK
jgi:hypothetical protein